MICVLLLLLLLLLLLPAVAIALALGNNTNNKHDRNSNHSNMTDTPVQIHEWLRKASGRHAVLMSHTFCALAVQNVAVGRRRGSRSAG